MNSTEIMQRALDAWSLYTHPYERYALLHESVASSDPEVVLHLMASLERYIQNERMSMLTQRWGSLESATPAMAEEISVPATTMLRISGVVAHYGINRAFLFLYVHAYLWSKMTKTGPLEVLNDLIDELDPR